MATLSQLLSDSGSNSGYVKELYEAYLADPTLVPERWRKTFEGLEREAFSGHQGYAGEETQSPYQKKVYNLITAYKMWGHFSAKFNPLSQGIAKPPVIPELTLEKHDLTNGASEGKYDTNGEFGNELLSLSRLLERLKNRYCGSIGFETEHCKDGDVRAFWSRKIAERESWKPSTESRVAALHALIAAEEFESGLHKKYVGQKRFSLQGGESTLAVLRRARALCAEHAIKEVVLCMAHRGRLNVLCNFAGKPLKKLFAEFEDKTYYALLGAGDVKYHKGYTTVFDEEKGKVTVSIVPNPSHLEFANPVVEGVSRAIGDLYYNRNRDEILPIQIHGDAAVIGQGIVPETLNLSLLKGYETGGTLHIVINNQIGFTTDTKESRSTSYCTDIMKGFDIPVLHVNGEDVDACLWAAEAALEYRVMFKRDVAIDLYCHRKYGHNEGDDPSFTQPSMYAELATRASVTNIYAQKLIAEKVITEQKLADEIASYKSIFAASGEEAATAYSGLGMPVAEGCGLYGLVRNEETKPPKVDKITLESIVATSIEVPAGFKIHPKLTAILEKRVTSLSAGGIDWGTSESLAYGTLLKEGFTIRLSGQDAGRGTFSHRHAELTNIETQERYVPLSKLSSNFEVINSCLSEAAVLGFEFGYATKAPKSLVMWEGQFGDFCNGAQVAIDQFIASSESKWDQFSGVVMLLPHGYEGQGPEHSSARLERFLQLCAEGNINVCYPTNGAQMYHLLRRHAYTPQKRPLVVMTPKSLLRLPQAGAALQDFTNGTFQEIIVTPGTAKQKRVVLCTGKVYYDIVNYFAAQKIAAQPAVIRLEQLYPFPQEALAKILGSMEEVLFVQEEPRNMGAWNYVRGELKDRFGIDAVGISRVAAASPAAGSTKRHAAETEWLLAELKAAL